MINGVNSTPYANQAVYPDQERTATQGVDRSTADESGVILDLGNHDRESEVYQKPASKVNREEINRLWEQSRQATDSIRELVRKLIEKQGKTVEGVLSGKETVVVDAETSAAAADLLADNGDWGVSAVSSRIVDFAKALAGGDPSKLEALKGAIQKGFEQAKEALGGYLPDICQQTYDETMKKLDEWGKADAPQNA
jgi:phosphoenolpyruvate-protein kinase (PTS system EI component)